MKIKEAKEKWCPFSRVIYNNSGTAATTNSPPPGTIQVVLPPVSSVATYNRQGGDNVPWECKCLADKCMAWRTVLADNDDGHCGLAGFQSHGG